MRVVQKTWGFELVLVNNHLYCGKLLLCLKEQWSSGGAFHYHPKKDETFVGLVGSLLLDIKGRQPALLKSLDTYRVEPGTRHRFTATTPVCLFLEVSTPDSDEDSIREEA